MNVDIPLASEEEHRRLKRQAAERAVGFVRTGMVIGLGAGSTAIFALRRIAELLRDGRLREVVGVPCSRKVGAEAGRLVSRSQALSGSQSSI